MSVPKHEIVEPWNHNQSCVLRVGGVEYRVVGGIQIPPFGAKGWFAAWRDGREVAVKKRFTALMRALAKHSKSVKP